MVSRESVRLSFLAAALNDLKLLVGDIQNEDLNAPKKERVYIIYDSEFGSDMDIPCNVSVVHATYDNS